MRERSKSVGRNKVLMRVIIMLMAIAIVSGAIFSAPLMSFATDKQTEASDTYTGIRQDSDGVYRLYINGKWQKNATYIYKKTQYIKNGVWQKDFTGFYKSAKDGKSYLIINGIFQKGATYIYNKTYYVKDGTWRNKFNGFYKSARDGKSYLIINGIFQKDATYLYIKDGKYYYVKDGTWRDKFNGTYVSPYDGNSYMISGGILDTDATYLYKYKGAYRYIYKGMWLSTFEGIYTSAYDGQSYYIKNGLWQSGANQTVAFNGSDYNVRHGMATKVVTEADRTLFRALNIVNEITTPDMTDAEKLRVCFDFVRTNYRESRPRTPHYTQMDWPVIYANDMFVRGTGNCCSYGAAFAYLAKAIGYEEVYACNSGGHGWAEVNGLVYDPEWSLHGPILHPQYGPYSYYATTYSPQMTDMNYRGGIAPGYAYMHIKI